MDTFKSRLKKLQKWQKAYTDILEHEMGILSTLAPEGSTSIDPKVSGEKRR